MINFNLMNLIITIPPGPPSQANNYIASNSHRTGYMIHFHSMNSCHLTGQMIHFHSMNCCYLLGPPSNVPTYMIHFHHLVAITILTGQLSLVPKKNYSHITGYLIHFHLMNLIIT